MSRAYLDWNATAPLRPEARDATVAALGLVGNPSSVHAEGRAARALVERARAQVAAAFGAEGADVVFTSGATEALALALAGRGLAVAGIEHDAALAWGDERLGCDARGQVTVADPAGSALQLANSETGVIQALPAGLAVTDLCQAAGKIALAFNWLGADAGVISAHKFGGPKGVGALILRRGIEIEARTRGGGQEMGRRAGTEAVALIAGMGAAAEAAARDLAAGVWDEVARLRDRFEAAIAALAPGVVVAGQQAPRLPNTSCLVAPGWKGETQVMQMDLAGFAVSAGSACSSGKLRASRTLQAMGFPAEDAASAIRVSFGPGVAETDLMRLAETWAAARARARARAA